MIYTHILLARNSNFFGLKMIFGITQYKPHTHKYLSCYTSEYVDVMFVALRESDLHLHYFVNLMNLSAYVSFPCSVAASSFRQVPSRHSYLVTTRLQA